MRALAPFRSWRTLCRGKRRLRPIRLEKRTSAAEAVKRTAIYGTAKGVPIVKGLFPIWLKALTNLIGIFGTAEAFSATVLGMR
jgi:hypothetical protein